MDLMARRLLPAGFCLSALIARDVFAGLFRPAASEIKEPARLFFAPGSTFRVAWQDNVIIGSRQTLGRAARTPQAERLFAAGAGRRHLPVRRRRGRAVLHPAAGHPAHRGRPGRQRRPETGAGAGADLCPRRQPGPAAPDHNRRRDREHRTAGSQKGRPRGRAWRPGFAGRRPVGRHPAQERRGVVVGCRPSGQRLEKAAGAEDQGARRSRRDIASASSAGPRPTSPCCG